MKLNKKFEPMLTLGERLVPGNDSKHFCQPTDVAVASSGEFFVADGYCNSRVMKFDKNGEFIASFGHANEPYKMDDFAFWIPHSLALIEDMNLICVADRENERIQCFSAGIGERGRTVPVGVFITKAENVGRVFAIREKFHNLVGVTGSDGNTIESQVFVMDINNGRADTFAKGIVNAHALEVSNDGVVYIGLIGPNEIVVTSLDDE
ncbi:hypothetical protein AB6A40_007981 [Gnathostoma spinigerum]|uniref:Peptidylamidoglycolate lyase n=1 Tax=Gnathostoma spinigerum TaxID=75299 RepID=A0ABD6EX68_9BILA